MASSTPRFTDPAAVSVTALWLSPCRTWSSRGELCLVADLAIHTGHTGEILLDSASYYLDETIADQVFWDFGPLTLAVLQRIRRHLAQSGAPRDEGTGEIARHGIRHLSRHLAYRLHPGVLLPLDVEAHVSQLAESFFDLSGRELLITSGTRTAKGQAEAMLSMIHSGANVRRLYKKSDLLAEILQAYHTGRKSGESRDGIVQRMSGVIAAQAHSGSYISPHLRAGAVDIRSRGMTAAEKLSLRRAVASYSNMKLNREEKLPPHFHLEVFTGRWPGPESISVEKLRRASAK